MRLRRARAFATLVLVASCATSTPDAILFGVDLCAFCHMPIGDEHFAAALVTHNGRTIKFDSIECLIEFSHKLPASDEAPSVWVSDYRHPGTMIPAETARIVELGPGRAPMGRGLAAVATARDAAAIGVIDSTQIKRWSEVQ